MLRFRFCPVGLRGGVFQNNIRFAFGFGDDFRASGFRVRNRDSLFIGNFRVRFGELTFVFGFFRLGFGILVLCRGVEIGIMFFTFLAVIFHRLVQKKIQHREKYNEVE